ncbi:hypothetical protein K491DRAFT_734134 [Lophiostoma macrostomum CBS 122681]|uniref:RING-type domain-containing protein n=1 Tax=Lophiostoma macrostomum CBS 122681 TaxID=1314788 RepID=A0A6A6TUX1_9PLEO|nr:hypothetical protein K491DRAFT_734134 [Lophiostoma macrostomum CBS 122681]
MVFPDRDTFLERGLTPLNPYDLPADQTQCFICFNSYLPDPACDPSIETAFELPEMPVQLRCGHVFGSDCIRHWTSPEEGKFNNTCCLCRAPLFDQQATQRAHALTSMQNFLDGEGDLPQDAPYILHGEDGLLVITRPSAERGFREFVSADFPSDYFLQDDDDDDESVYVDPRELDLETNPILEWSSFPAIDSAMLSPPDVSASPFAHRSDVLVTTPDDGEQGSQTESQTSPLFTLDSALSERFREPGTLEPIRRAWSPTAHCGFGVDSDSDSNSSVEDEIEQDIESAAFEHESLVERHAAWEDEYMSEA